MKHAFVISNVAMNQKHHRQSWAVHTWAWLWSLGRPRKGHRHGPKHSRGAKNFKACFGNKQQHAHIHINTCTNAKTCTSVHMTWLILTMHVYIALICLKSLLHAPIHLYYVFLVGSEYRRRRWVHASLNTSTYMLMQQ